MCKSAGVRASWKFGVKFVETVSVCHGAQPARFTRHNAAKQIKGCAPFPRPLFKTPKTDRRTMPIFSPRSAKFFSNRGFCWIFPTEIVEPEKRVYTCMFVRVCVCTYMIRRKKEKREKGKAIVYLSRGEKRGWVRWKDSVNFSLFILRALEFFVQCYTILATVL